MKAAKCPNYGANITIAETKDAGICEFCNTAFVTEKAISYVNNTSNNAQTIINNYYTYTAPTANTIHPDRPKINMVIALLLFWCYIIPGIIYVRSVRKKQKKWDAKHNN